MDKEINLMEYGRQLWKARFDIAKIVGFLTLLSVVISLLLPKTYISKATLIPIGGVRSGGMGLLGGDLSLGSLLGGGGGGTRGGALLAILKSRTLAERMIEQHDLKKVLFRRAWDPKNQRWKTKDPVHGPAMESAVDRLLQKISFQDEKKDQTIIIQAEMNDPQLAADLVNGYVNELMAYLNENAFTAAKRNRIFVEEQLERNKVELLESGKRLNSFYATQHISNIDPTLDVNTSLEDSFRQKETISENKKLEKGNGTETRVVAEGNSDGIPGISKAHAALQEKVQELQKKIEDVGVVVQDKRFVQKVPQQVYLQYLNLQYNLLGQSNSLLTQQYELAKIEEAKENLSFQVIDWGRAPISKSKPQRSKIVLSSFFMAFLTAVAFVLIRGHLKTRTA